MNDITKRCPKCNEYKTLNNFYKNKSRKDGLSAYCKICTNQLNIQTHNKNKEHYKKYQKQWKAANREYVNSRDKKYREEHPEIEFKKQKKYRETHKEQLYEKGKKYRETHRDYFKVKYKERKNNIKSTNDGSITQALLEELLLLQDNKCTYCGCKLTPDNKHMDHIIPISRGGTHTADNIHYVCKGCNQSKGSKLESEWLIQKTYYDIEK